MLEFGIPAKKLPLPLRARDRFPIFIRAAWRMFVENPRLMLLFGISSAFLAANQLVLGEAALPSPEDLPLGSTWTGYLASGLLTTTVSLVIECAALFAVCSLFRGRELDLRRGLSAALRVLVPITLFAIVFVGVDFVGKLLDSAVAIGVGILITFPAGIVLPIALFYAIPILADTGGGFGAAAANSWLLVRLTLGDVVLGIVFIVAVPALLAFLPALDVSASDPASTLGQVVTVIAAIPISAFAAFYAARLYVFARSVEAAAEVPEGADGWLLRTPVRWKSKKQAWPAQKVGPGRYISSGSM